MRDDPTFDSMVPLPSSIAKRNGGQKCDMLIGPCACGAWHTVQEVAEAYEQVERLSVDIAYLKLLAAELQSKHIKVLEQYRKLKQRKSHAPKRSKTS